MKHYWINIRRSEKRKIFMEEQMKKYNLENYRVEACTPDDFDEILKQKRPLTCGYPGCTTCEYEYACLISHIRAMQEGLKSGDEYFVILEDDITMPFKINYEALIKDIPRDTEILQMLILYGNTVKQLYEMYKATDKKYIKWQYLLPSAGMYIISRTGAEKIIKLFYDEKTKKYDFSSSPYQIVADVLLYETVKTYATTVPYAYPNIEMGSEIHPEHLIAHSMAIKDIKDVMKNNEIRRFPFLYEKDNNCIY